MATAGEDRHVLASAKRWVATPGDYSSLRSLRLDQDGTGELLYGYGQTIYLVIPCGWAMPAAGRLRLTFSAPTRGRLASEFVLDDGNQVKELGYTLTEGRVAGVESVVAIPYEFDRTLELSAPPWPDGLDLPHKVPRVFYGRVPTDQYVQPEVDDKDEPWEL